MNLRCVYDLIPVSRILSFYEDTVKFRLHPPCRSVLRITTGYIFVGAKKHGEHIELCDICPTVISLHAIPRSPRRLIHQTLQRFPILLRVFRKGEIRGVPLVTWLKSHAAIYRERVAQTPICILDKLSADIAG